MTQSDQAEPRAAPASPRPSGGRRGRPSRLPYLAAIAMLGVWVATAWLARDRFRPVVAGEPAPSFEAATLDGDPVGLDPYRGKVVLLNIWATWCVPCREEMPSMERLYRELSGRDFEILAVSVDDPVGGEAPVDQLSAFVDELGLTFPILHDREGSIERIYQTTGVPESFLIGPDGVIYRRIAGATSWDSPQYREQILRLLEE